MTKYEYKTVRLSLKGTVFKSREIPDFESILNREGKEGWRLYKVIQSTAALGETNAVILVFERELVKSTDD